MMMFPPGFHNLFIVFVDYQFLQNHHFCTIPRPHHCFLHYDSLNRVFLSQCLHLFLRYILTSRLFPSHKHNLQHIMMVIQNKM